MACFAKPTPLRIITGHRGAMGYNKRPHGWVCNARQNSATPQEARAHKFGGKLSGLPFLVDGSHTGVPLVGAGLSLFGFIGGMLKNANIAIFSKGADDALKGISRFAVAVINGGKIGFLKRIKRNEHIAAINIGGAGHGGSPSCGLKGLGAGGQKGLNGLFDGKPLDQKILVNIKRVLLRLAIIGKRVSRNFIKAGADMGQIRFKLNKRLAGNVCRASHWGSPCLVKSI